MSTGAASGSARDRLLGLLAAAERDGRTVPFWWRDDDAETATPALELMLELARRHGLPLGLAVIAQGASQTLSARLAAEPRIAVLQHGWQHRAHNPVGEKNVELGNHRPLPAILEELRAGRERLEALFGRQFLPVLVPPWNRIAPEVADARTEAGLPGLSAFGRQSTGEPHCANAHLDIFDWKPIRRPIVPDRAFELLCGELRDRQDGNPEPVGILTHHLIHEEASWTLLDELFGILAHHPAAVWPPVPDVFGLPG
jgi:peptidoglycan/xylan/chitin deacetylase (PgdA/CDA1 family)